MGADLRRDDLERLLRASLEQRAHDVEPTPVLWQRVDARIRRRRWQLAGAWALAGVAAVLAAVVVVPAVLPDPEPGVPEIADQAPATDDVPTDDDGEVAEDAPDPDPGPEPSEPGDGEGAPGPDADAAPGLPAPLVAVDGPDLVLLGPDGPTTLVSLPAEGESVFTAIAVRPGSRVDDLTVASRTTAEGMVDLRVTRVVDGEVTVAFAPFEEPSATHVSDLVWSPDGSSLAWVEEGASGATTLRTIGWSEGADEPGTGEAATDNAGFALEVPTGLALQPQGWVGTADSDRRTRLVLTTPEPEAGWWDLTLERQTDGAWAVPASVDGEPPLLERTAEAPGNAVAVAPFADGSAWLVVAGPDGLVAVPTTAGGVADPTGGLVVPDDVLPDDGLPEVWVAALDGSQVAVGGRGTGVGYLLGPDDTATALPVSAVDGGFLPRG